MREVNGNVRGRMARWLGAATAVATVALIFIGCSSGHSAASGGSTMLRPRRSPACAAVSRLGAKPSHGPVLATPTTVGSAAAGVSRVAVSGSLRALFPDPPMCAVAGGSAVLPPGATMITETGAAADGSSVSLLGGRGSGGPVVIVSSGGAVFVFDPDAFRWVGGGVGVGSHISPCHPRVDWEPPRSNPARRCRAMPVTPHVPSTTTGYLDPQRRFEGSEATMVLPAGRSRALEGSRSPRLPRPLHGRSATTEGVPAPRSGRIRASCCGQKIVALMVPPAPRCVLYIRPVLYFLCKRS